MYDKDVTAGLVSETPLLFYDRVINWIRLCLSCVLT